METMKLKDVVGLVEKTLSENKFQSVMQSGNPYYLLSYEEKQKWFGNAPPIEWDEIENLNNTFWDCDIKPGMEMAVSAAIAVNLANQCMTEDERKGMLNRIQALRENVSENWLRRLNKRKKFNGEDGICGVFNKFELIQKFGYMYDSEDEGNADANDTTATCPIIIGQLNSGWVNYRAGEKDGKIMVEHRRNGYRLTPAVLLLMIYTAFQNCSVRILYDDSRKDAKRAQKILDISIKLMIANDGFGNHYADVKCSPMEFYDYVEAVLTDEERYSQSVFDFKTVNAQFLPMLENACLIIECLDETQTWLARRLYKDTLENMKVMSELEIRIIEEQQLRDPDTGMFVKPKFNTRHLYYTIVLSTILHLLKEQFMNIMRRYALGDSDDDLYTLQEDDLAKECINKKIKALREYPIVL